MKKLFTSLVFILCCIAMNGQVFTDKIVIDRFEDVLSDVKQKTIVTVGPENSFVTFEEKGSDPVSYGTMWIDEAYSTKGSKDEIVNLIDDIYGYEEYFAVMGSEDYDKCFALSMEAREGGEAEVAAATDFFDKHICEITHRVIVSQFAHTFQAELWWIEFPDGSRTIYRRR